MFNITIVTVNWYSAEHILSTLQNLHSKAKQKEKLCALIIDNTNGMDYSLNILGNAPIKHDIIKTDNRNLSGSKAHASALDIAMKNLKTDFSVIVDPDIHLFFKDWDVFCIGEMEKQQAIAIGAPYPLWKVGKYHDFPSPPFCFFHTKTLQKLDNDWSPFSTSSFQNARTFCFRQVGRLGNLLTRNRYEKHHFLRKYAEFSEKVFGVFSQDTGWKLAKECLHKNLNSIVFNSVLPEDAYALEVEPKDVFLSMTREFELFSYNGQLFLAHKYGSGGLPWRTKRGDDFIFWKHCIRNLESSLSHSGWKK